MIGLIVIGVIQYRSGEFYKLYSFLRRSRCLQQSLDRRHVVDAHTFFVTDDTDKKKTARGTCIYY